MGFRINLVEDERNLNELLTTYLQKEGWEVSSFLNGQDARNAIPNRPHLWILDIMLPDIDGYQLLKEIKTDSPGLPVIYISARDAELDRVIGLEIGGDDYLPKPFLPRELVIRTHRLLDRVYAPVENLPVISFPPYTIDQNRRLVMFQNEELDLTSKEFDILLLFCRNCGKAFSREQIIEQVWGEDYVGSDRVVDDLIRRLRRKMPQLKLETIYGYGYRMIKA